MVRVNVDRCDEAALMAAQRLTGREYMALIFSLNCMVAVTKMFSVSDSVLPLERKSFTFRGIKSF